LVGLAWPQLGEPPFSHIRLPERVVPEEPEPERAASFGGGPVDRLGVEERPVQLEDLVAARDEDAPGQQLAGDHDQPGSRRLR